jgi:hypothetical protein
MAAVVFLIFMLLMFMVSEVFFTKDKGLKVFRLDDILFHFAIFFVALAITMPFIIRWWYKSYKDYSGLAALGPVGDFIGGSTIAFFNLASVSLLVATLLIQRRELKETQKEYKITNETMKKQQFESTFFNMIDLQHNILKEIKINKDVGREAIKVLYYELRDTYQKDMFNNHKNKMIEDLMELEIDELNEITVAFLDNINLHNYLEPRRKTMDNSAWEKFYNGVINGNDLNWEKLKQFNQNHFQRNVKDNRHACKSELENLLDFDTISSRADLPTDALKNFRREFYERPIYAYKFKAYEKLYNYRENIIGHYYRNLYRIVKLIQTNTFGHEDEKIIEEVRRIYRGILRAQLSSFELLMIFYNVVYSKKGLKFKDLLLDINFFDDHLIIKDFIWNNDIGELEDLEPSKKHK